jgi:hypothetical protein
LKELQDAGTLHPVQVRADALRLSASDLVGHLNCRYLTGLDLRVANGTLAKPVIWDPVLEVLAERGRQHEQGYVAHLKSKGLGVIAIDRVGVDDEAVLSTLAAMKAGIAVIAQAALQANNWGAVPTFCCESKSRAH